MLKAGAWYLVARAGADIRTYRVAAIQGFQQSEETFARPADFDLAAHWAQSLERFEASLRTGEAHVRLSPQGVRRIARLGPAAAEAAAAADEGPDGWREVTLRVEAFDNAAVQFLALGRHIEVLGPPELRERIHALAVDVAQRHVPK